MGINLSVKETFLCIAFRIFDLKENITESFVAMAAHVFSKGP